MKKILVFIAGSIILFPALAFILSGEVISFAIGVLYIVAINIFIPKSFWLNWWKVNLRITKLIEK